MPDGLPINMGQTRPERLDTDQRAVRLRRWERAAAAVRVRLCGDVC